MKQNQKTEITNIRILLQNAFAGPAWHGPSLTEALTGISPDIATRKKTAAHSIIELVLHMATWRNFVTRRLLGDNAFEVSDKQNFPKGEDWDLAISNIQKCHRDLLDALEKFPATKLGEIVAGRDYDFYTMLHGIIQHDIYHTGQIVLLKKQFEVS